MKHAFLFILLSASAFAADYYVSPTGKDSNTGTSPDQAWLTLARANAAAQPGDTIVIGAGEFNADTISSKRNGTAEKPIVWQGISARETIIRTTSWLPYAFKISHDHIHFKTMRFVNASINVYYGGDHGLIDGCHFEQPTHSHIYFEGGTDTHMKEWVVRNCEFREASDRVSKQACIRLCGSKHLFENNYFTSSLGGADVFHYLGSGTVIRRNTFENWGVRPGSKNHVDFVQSFTNNPSNIAEDLLVEGNFCRNMNGVQFGNVTDSAQTGRVRNWTFRNNIFHRVSNTMNLYAPGFRFENNVFSHFYGSGGAILFRGSGRRGKASSGFVYNNIFYRGGINPANATDQGWYSNDAGGSGIIADNNLVVGIGAGTVKGSKWRIWGNANSLNGVDPLFVGAAAINAGNPETKVVPEDFRLRPNSPALGRGMNLTEEFMTDIAGAQRPGIGPWDIGPFQSKVKPPDTTPPSLRCANIAATGTQIILCFDEWVEGVKAELFTLPFYKLSNAQGAGPNWTMDVDRKILPVDELKLVYTTDVNGIVDTAGNQLQSGEHQLVNGALR